MNVEVIIPTKIEIFLNKVSRDDVDLQSSINSDDMQDSDATTILISLDTVETQWSSVEANSYDVLQNPTFLSTLCSQCFEDNSTAKVGFLSFDGNFQHKHFLTKKNVDNKYLELRNQRLFIDDKTIPDVISFHILQSWIFWFPEGRGERWHHSFVMKDKVSAKSQIKR